MKKLLLILMLAFSFNLNAQQIQTDSIAVTLDVVEKGFYTVWLDTVEISRHSKALKAVSRANGLRLKYPLATIKVTQPDLVPEGTIKVYANSEPCVNNDALTIVKTSDDTVIVELPSDDTGYYTVFNPDNKTLIALGKTYANTQILNFVQSASGWELLN
ncbi:MAG: hypothetical protein WBF67_09005 [Olleya sp.]